MPKQRSIPRGVVALGSAFCLLTAQAWVRAQGEGDAEPTKAPTAVERQPSNVEVLESEDLGGAMRRATDHFRAERFVQALEEFQRALGLLQSDSERATIEFNLASCWFELTRYDEAERHYLRAAELDASGRDKALLYASAAALRSGRLEAAESHLLAAGATGPDLLPRQQALAREIAEERAQAERRRFLKAVDEGAKLLRKEDYAGALRTLESALLLRSSATRQETADARYAAGMAAFRLGDAERARAHFQAGLATDPNDAELQQALGQAEAALKRPERAEEHYQRALELGLAEPGAEQARAALWRIRGLPVTGWHGLVGAGLGYDNNPAHSGPAATTGVAGPDQGGSPYVSLGGELGFTGRIGRLAAGRAYYAGDFIGLTDSPYRELTLQIHQVGVRGYFSPNSALRLRAMLAPSLALVGTDPVQPFYGDLAAGVRGDLSHSRIASTRLELVGRLIQGLNGWSFVGGQRMDAELSEILAWTWLDLRAGSRFRYNAIGIRSENATDFALAGCDARCTGATYRIPLGYWGTGGFVEGLVELTPRLGLGVTTSLEYRRYLEDSMITRIPLSRKRRSDVRWAAEARVEIGLEPSATWYLIPSYSALVSRSNVAYSAIDPEHNLDYDHRQFVQHLGEAVVEARF